MNNDGKYNICIDICPCEECDCDEEDYVLAQAYQKQIPKKPMLMQLAEPEYMCECGMKYWRKGGVEYCIRCGQVIDWSVEDE